MAQHGIQGGILWDYVGIVVPRAQRARNCSLFWNEARMTSWQFTWARSLRGYQSDARGNLVGRRLVC